MTLFERLRAKAELALPAQVDAIADELRRMGEARGLALTIETDVHGLNIRARGADALEVARMLDEVRA